MYDTAYTNGMIAVKEKSLLGEKILRLPEMTAEEAVRALSESGFGGGVREKDEIVAAEERALDGFIRAFAPTRADEAYFLAPRDFHNLKALYKAKKLSVDPRPMLAPEGLFTVEALQETLAAEKPPVPSIPEDATGAEIGAAFDGAMFGYLFRVCAGRKNLKTMLSARVDMINLLTAFRAENREAAEKLFLKGGTLSSKTYDAVFSQDEKERAGALAGTPYQTFYAACLAAGKTPFTGAERLLGTFEAEIFRAKRFELEGREPFLYYVLRRRAEIGNVRTVLMCLEGGVSANEIKKRLVGV